MSWSRQLHVLCMNAKYLKTTCRVRDADEMTAGENFSGSSNAFRRLLSDSPAIFGIISGPLMRLIVVQFIGPVVEILDGEQPGRINSSTPSLSEEDLRLLMDNMFANTTI
jgi:hypothetical protein